MYALLFERIWTLAAVLLAAQFLLIAIWSWLRTPRSGRAVKVGFVAVPVLLALSYFVVTPRERIARLCEALADAVTRKDAFAFDRHLAPDFALGNIDRADVVPYIDRLFQRTNVANPILHAFSFDIVADEATVEFSAKTDVEYDNWRQSWLPTRWRIQCRKIGGDWRVTSIESIPVPPLHMKDLQEYVP